METPTTLRECTRCGESKTTDHFARSRRGRDGLHSYCRQCMAEYMAGKREHVGHRPRPCEWCETPFTPKDVRAQYCSDNCKMRARYWRLNPREVRQCPICSTDITNRRRDTEFCSEPCAREQRRLDGRTKTACRKTDLKRRYKMSPDDYERKLQEQGNRCAICRTDDPGTAHGFWQIDHDHGCCPIRSSQGCGACVRGLLCSSCNLGLGHFADDPDRLDAAAAYLRSFYADRSTEVGGT
jgi:hypothetical protein